MKTPYLAIRITSALLLAFAWIGIPMSAQAEDRLAQIFQDNMVLQRDKPVPVWGWTSPGAQVEVSFEGQKKQAKANEKGYWKAILDPLKANRTGQVLAVKIGTTTMSRKNVLVGEVWFSAGQSNTVHAGPDLDSGIYPHYISPGTKGGKPEIRFTDFGFGASLEPQDDIDPAGRGPAPWKVLQEDPPLTEMGPIYYASRVIRDAVDVPVGIVHLGLPGIAQLTWMSRETLEAYPSQGGKHANFYQEQLARSEDHLASSSGPVKSWAAFLEVEKAWRETKKGRWPGPGQVPTLWMMLSGYPTTLYNTRIHPLAPFAVRGAFFQANHGDKGAGAAERFVANVKQWRGLFGQDFYFIHSTNCRDTTSQPPLTPLCTDFYRSTASIAVRQTIKLFGDDKKVATVELYDLGDQGTHFLQKNEMGRRLGLAALTVAYGQNDIYTGPRVAETKIAGNKAIVRFEQIGDGIVYQPSIDGISGVYLRGKTGTGRWGQVKVMGKDTVELSHPDIANLEMVAYGENINPHETLFNSAGLPASPFTVNMVKGSDPQPRCEILSMPGKDAKSPIKTSLCHVRRSGYVFQIVGKEKDDPGLLAKAGENGDSQKISASVPVQAYIPAEWKGFEVEAGGKKLDVTETTKDATRFVTFNAPVDGTWIIVAESGKAVEFRKVNRF